MIKKLIGIALSLALLIALTSCSPGGKTVTVGAKTFTEQLILEKMTTFILQKEGFRVEEIQNLGSSAMRQALTTQQIDMTWEYVGTALVTYLGEDPIVDKNEAMKRVQELDKKNKISWTNLTEANNTYVMAVKPELAEKLGLETLSDLAKYVKEHPNELTFGMETEFANRPDGLPGLEKAYNFDLPNNQQREMEVGLYYSAIANDEIDVTEGYSTDGQIEEQNLKILKDDRAFFPSYNVALSINQETLDQYPEIEKILQPLEEKLTSDSLRQLNYKVDVEGQSVERVAQDFLEENNLLD
ncbi:MULTISPECIES: glycine betaine ABC transporter substrate-binding protein [Bacillus]|uniref:Glycine/betaine ABC transporter substrate-binding protein n=2 Tax=Bacillus TaxID=1386 RepID=A0A0M3R9U5_9BACI|nr:MULTISPECIES: glycine betaine ABC transporter substrate-binding protein [Bacillus]ALC82036.1 glycine/betaine ABC transporter substrate-binding protein [Bacillus gobiensis]MBP1083382.1 osmoprotectant transport system substrate-binding protein [Bacillus capparidis]MED1097814.1 glycine betaine ABC transporter substrate-binding protein [Bacillus capparidis]